MKTIFTRRSIRRFKDIPVSDEQIQLLMKAAFCAPSARDLEPWEFIVVTNRQRLSEMSNLAPSAKPLKEAALGIVVCANLKKNDQLEYCEQDLAAATENILLEANHLGLGGVWIGMHPTPGRAQRLKVVFQLPDHIFPLWMIAIGYPDEEDEIKDKFNEEAIHYEEW